jgi:hypothetical protein
MLGNQLPDHFEVAEFFNGDILKHVADGRVLNVKGLNPVLKSGCEFACGAAELFEQIGSKFGVWLADVHRLDKSFIVEEH